MTMKLTYASAADWATRDPAPDPAEIEAYAAQRNLDIVSVMLGYEASDAEKQQEQQRRKGKGGFAYVLEEWLLPAVGAAALLFGVVLLGPSTIFGDSFGWYSNNRSTWEIDTVNYTNLDGRILTAIISSLIGFALLVGNIVSQLVTKKMRGESSAAAAIMMVIAGVGLVYIWLLTREGFDGFAIPALVYCGVIAAGIVTIIIYYAQGGHRRGRNELQPKKDTNSANRQSVQAQRLAQAEAQFAQLPHARQQEILADRAQAVQVLTQRGVLHPQVAQNLPNFRFGQLTQAMSRD